MSEDVVNHPSHYKANASGIETIKITKDLDFCLGNAVKYISRADHKGKREEDLQKAAWYLSYVAENTELKTRAVTDLTQEELLYIDRSDLPTTLKTALTLIISSYDGIYYNIAGVEAALSLVEEELADEV